MKMRSLFFSMLALAAMTSCSNDDNAAAVDNTTKSVKLALNYDELTRAISAPQTAGAPTLSKVKVQFFASEDGTGNALKEETLTDEQIATLNAAGAPVAATKSVVVKAPDAANSLRIVANNGDATTISKSIVDYQGKDVKKAVPYEGVGKILASGKDYAATVPLNVAVARIEVSGIIKPKSTKWTVEVIGVYANNFVATLGTPSLFTLEGAEGEVTNTLLTGMFDLKATDAAAWATSFVETTPTACAGYQLFAGSYGVTLQVKATKQGETEVTKFIVIKGFNKADGDKSAITTLEAGKIYKLDLTASGLGDKYTDDEDPGTGDPAGDKSVTVAVNVMQWTVQNVTPNL